jgi:hypothetical protein
MVAAHAAPSPSSNPTSMDSCARCWSPRIIPDARQDELAFRYADDARSRLVEDTARRDRELLAQTARGGLVLRLPSGGFVVLPRGAFRPPLPFHSFIYPDDSEADTQPTHLPHFRRSFRCAQLRQMPLQTNSCSAVFFEHSADLPKSLPPLTAPWVTHPLASAHSMYLRIWSASLGRVRPLSSKRLSLARTCGPTSPSHGNRYRCQRHDRRGRAIGSVEPSKLTVTNESKDFALQ